MKTFYGSLALAMVFTLLFCVTLPVQAEDAAQAPLVISSASDNEDQDGPSGIASAPSGDEDQDGRAGIISAPSDDEDQDGAAGITSDPSSDEDQDGSAGIASDPSSEEDQDGPSAQPEPQKSESSDSQQSSGSIARFGGNLGQGQVLGASASCSIYLSAPLSYGGKNDPKNVEKLQAFLNENIGTDLILDGIFGKSTLAAVKKFQLAHKSIIIDPWIKNGKNPRGIATGYVGSTTLWTINDLVCPSLQLPKPVI